MQQITVQKLRKFVASASLSPQKKSARGVEDLFSVSSPFKEFNSVCISDRLTARKSCA